MPAIDGEDEIHKGTSLSHLRAFLII